MSILGKLIKYNRKVRNRELALAIALSATAGVLTGIAVNSKSDKISKTFKKIKNKSTECIEDGKNKIEDLVQDGKDQMEDLKEDGKNKTEDLVNTIEDLLKEKKVEQK